MPINQILADNLLNAYSGPNWTDVSIIDTLNGIDYQQAQLKTNASPNTIAGLVHHLYFWNQVIMDRISGSDPVIPDVNGFDVELLSNENDWKKLIEKLHASIKELANTIRSVPVEKWNATTQNGESTLERNIFGIVEHAYYHLGQIVMLKHLLV